MKNAFSRAFPGCSDPGRQQSRALLPDIGKSGKSVTRYSRIGKSFKFGRFKLSPCTIFYCFSASDESTVTCDAHFRHAQTRDVCYIFGGDARAIAPHRAGIVFRVGTEKGKPVAGGAGRCSGRVSADQQPATRSRPRPRCGGIVGRVIATDRECRPPLSAARIGASSEAHEVHGRRLRRCRGRDPRRRSRRRAMPSTCRYTRSSTPISRASAARRSISCSYSICIVAFRFVPSGTSGRYASSSLRCRLVKIFSMCSISWI